MTNSNEQPLSYWDRIAEQEHQRQSVFLSNIPEIRPCSIHPGFLQRRDNRRSWLHRDARYQDCELCLLEKEKIESGERLAEMGVPLNLRGATFENWTPADEQAEPILASVREFAKVRRGFLLLLGDLGTGKTHLAVAALRTFKTGWLVKQSELLRCLRDTYRDKAAVDPVDKAQNVGCLVLDEMGLSAGGRDELPLLHDVLDHRHGNQMPTILTGNIELETMRAVIGERMADRLRESAFAVLNFGGESNRLEARARYFEHL